MNANVGIVMGSKSDLPIMQDAAAILKQLDVPFQIDIVSAHRTPDRLYEYGKQAEALGLTAIIAGAGGAAHLPGMMASLTTVPVIGVPVSTTSLQGQDSLLSIVQMPRGIPVATVAIDNATNAGLLAAQMAGCYDPGLRQRLQDYRSSIAKAATQSADALESLNL